MGIRYLAFAIPASEATEEAAAAPQDYFRSLRTYAGDPPSPPELEPAEVLDLDKAWSVLQRVLRADDAVRGESPGAASTERPAYELVRGDVEMTSQGWRSYVRVLTPEQVSAAAADLADVGECEVLEQLARRRGRLADQQGTVESSGETGSQCEVDPQYERDADDALDAVRLAVPFLRKIAGQGHGLAYSIG